MGYRIRYEQKRNQFPWWLLIPTAGVAALWREGWYEALARFVGDAIRGH